VKDDGLASSSNNSTDLDWNLSDGDDASECIFPYSLEAYNDASNGKPVSTPPPHDTNMLSKDLHGRITKGIQSAFSIMGSSNTSLKIASQDCDYWSR
jgi:hypothetical protein